MKWCRRISETSTCDLVYQEALDCFCWSVRDVTKRAQTAAAIGAKLNVNQAKVDYYVRNYKPDIHVQKDSVRIGRQRLARVHQDLAASLR